MRFDLSKLPACGANTRKGTPCKRRGNRSNGRCKLHGGLSTGPSTEIGKAISKHNAKKSFPDDLFFKVENQELLLKAHAANALLVHLMTKEEIDWREVNQVVHDNLMALEYSKWRLVEYSTPLTLLVLQTALDSYYQDTKAPHLKFHVFGGMQMLTMFSRNMTRAQQARFDQWLRKQPMPWDSDWFKSDKK
ncbi:hypothetical protein FDM56_14105 [Vibrio cholerae]|nr:hypothetical protein [Vibrio cholerae]